MKKRKLKPYVLPTLYVLIIVVSFFSIAFINSYLYKDTNDYDYTKSIMQEDTKPIIKEEEPLKSFLKPYTDENISIETTYYNKDDNEETQINSLLSYERTYMPSTGCMYISDSKFDIVSVYDGTVTDIRDDEVFGKVIEVTHNSNLITYYYSVDEVMVEENALIVAGDKIGTSTINKLDPDHESLYFEVYYQGKSLNPEEFYLMQPNELV